MFRKKYYSLFGKVFPSLHNTNSETIVFNLWRSIADCSSYIDINPVQGGKW